MSIEASEIVSIEGSLLKRGKLVSDHLVRSAGASWQEIEALPQPLRWTVQRTIFHLLIRKSESYRARGSSRRSVSGAGLGVAAGQAAGWRVTL